MRYILWLLTGAALALAILLGFALIGLARLNPWFARRWATSSLAAGALRVACKFGVAHLTRTA
jgi:hypothetical protein